MSTGTASVSMEFTDELDPINAQESKPASEYVDREDTCHVCISGMRPLTYTDENKDEHVIGFTVKLTVLAASDGNEDLVEKIHFEDFRFGQESHQDHGKFCNDRQRVFLVASGKVDPLLRGGPYQIEYTIDGFQDFQFITTFKEKRPMKNAKKTSDKKYFEIDGLKMWHIDDPEVASVNKAAEYLDLAPGERWTEEQKKAVLAKREAARAAAEAKKKPGGKGNGGAAPLPTKLPAKALSQDELDTI